jgi:hypothetical protein
MVAISGSANYDLPFGHGKALLSRAPGVVNQIIGGWRVYLISTMETGQYFSPSFSGSDPCNTNTIGGLPDRICNGNLPAGHRTVNHWLTHRFTKPAPGNFGNSGMNVLLGPGRDQQDLTLSKTFPMGERFRFTPGAAATNLLNHPNFWNPASNISVPGSVGVVKLTKTAISAGGEGALVAGGIKLGVVEESRGRGGRAGLELGIGDASGDQDASVFQQGGGVLRAAHRHGAGLGKCRGGRIVQFSAVEALAEAGAETLDDPGFATGDQDRSAGQQGGGVPGPAVIHGGTGGECSGGGVVRPATPLQAKVSIGDNTSTWIVIAMYRALELIEKAMAKRRLPARSSKGAGRRIKHG